MCLLLCAAAGSDGGGGGGSEGEEYGLANGLMDVVSKTPRVSMSRLSLMTTVPSARRACSKSSSVREMRRWRLPSRAATGCRPAGKDDGGRGDRGDGCWCRNSDARMAQDGRREVVAVGDGVRATVHQTRRRVVH